uniref:5-hydroxytryptamine receptor 3A n=1 Tax=Pygocentrus nattereri TaxID=42514 RepID=A0A3B4CI49_PYGNA
VHHHASLSVCELRCLPGDSGPSFDSLQEVFDRKPFRPAVNLSNPTITNISFTLYAVLGRVPDRLCVFLQYWFHEFLIWDPDVCDGITRISLPVNNVWMPDIIVYDVDDDVSQACPYVYVNHTGHIRYDRMLRLVSACNLEIFSFPFDIQNCTFTFGSYMHTSNTALPFDQISGNSKRYLEASGEWELVEILGEEGILKFGVDEWDIITFWVVIKRRPILYVVNLLIPSSFLMIIDILSFYLPPHSVDRASFKMTLILGYTVFLLIMNDLLPSTANGTPIIGIYFSVCLALMVISLLETVIITNVLHHNSMKYRDVPRWRSRCLFWFRVLVCVSGGVAVPELVEICADLRAMRSHLNVLQREEKLQDQWCHVGYILDFLLFRIYLVIITCYALVIISMWCIWMYH